MKKYSLALSIVFFLVIVFGANLAFAENKMEAASVENMAFPLPDKPSFAVLPFNDMGEESEPQYFNDSFTYTLIFALSEVPSVFAISPFSTFKYKGKPITSKQVAEELGVHYVVKGNFQKSGDQSRINVQMIDALKGYPVWSEHYDFNIKDTFKIQNDIILNMVKSAGAKYDKLIGESHPVAGTNNIDAYLSLWNSFHYFQKRSPEGHRKSKELCEQAIALDPNYFWPYIGLALTYTDEARWGFSESPEKSMELALNMAQTAVNLGKTHSQAYAAMGRVLYSLREHDKAIAVLERAIALNPENADAQSWLGWTLNYAGRLRKQFQFSKR